MFSILEKRSKTSAECLAGSGEHAERLLENLPISLTAYLK